VRMAAIMSNNSIGLAFILVSLRIRLAGIG